MNPGLAIQRPQRLSRILAGGEAPISFTLTMVTIAAAIAWVMGIAGVYGVVAYLANGRGREFGVRLALGADPVAIVRLVLRSGVGFAVWGRGVGLLMAYWMGRFLEGVLFGVRPHDPFTFVAAVVILVPSVLLACALPAWKAARTDPCRILRSE